MTRKPPDDLKEVMMEEGNRGRRPVDPEAQRARREKLADVVNRSINQTLSRTILTAGLTFLTVLALYLFGGEVLHGFSFALVIGILIGTYSSIAIAAPILVAYQDWRSGRNRPSMVVPGGGAARREKVKAKA